MEAITVERGADVAVGRHRVGVASQDHPRRSIEPGTGHDVVADPGHLEPGRAAQLGLDPIPDQLARSN